MACIACDADPLSPGGMIEKGTRLFRDTSAFCLFFSDFSPRAMVCANEINVCPQSGYASELGPIGGGVELEDPALTCLPVCQSPDARSRVKGLGTRTEPSMGT